MGVLILQIEVVGEGRTKKKKPIEYTVDSSGCWICTSHYKDKDGYPKICINWKHKKLSRYMYERFVGKIPFSQVIRHKCDVRGCINPDHLEIGTPKDNTNDMIERGRDRKASGEENGMAKLTWDKVRKIRTDTRKIAVIARDYSVSPRCIRDVKTYAKWMENVSC